MEQNYLLRRTEHRGFVRYQRSDYLLTGRVVALGRRGVVLIRGERGIARLRLQAHNAGTQTAPPLSLLFRRIAVRVIGQDSEGVLLAQRWDEAAKVAHPESPDVSPRCPDCERTMVVRQLRDGPSRGALVWGCPAHPLCQAVRHLA